MPNTIVPITARIANGAATPPTALLGIETLGIVTPETFVRIAHPDLYPGAGYPEDEDPRQAIVSLARLRDWLATGTNPYVATWSIDDAADALVLTTAGLIVANRVTGLLVPTPSGREFLRLVDAWIARCDTSPRPKARPRRRTENYMEGV